MKALSVMFLVMCAGVGKQFYEFIPSTVYQFPIKPGDTLNYNETKIFFSEGFKDSISIVYKDSVIFNEYVADDIKPVSYFIVENYFVENHDTLKIFFHDDNVYTFLEVNYNYKFISIYFNNNFCIQSYRNSFYQSY